VLCLDLRPEQITGLLGLRPIHEDPANLKGVHLTVTPLDDMPL